MRYSVTPFTNHLGTIMKKLRFVLFAAAMLCGSAAIAEDTTKERLQQEVEALQAQLQKLQAQVEALAGQQEKVMAAQPAMVQATAQSAAAQESKASSDTTIGGYGEMNYNNFLKDSSRNQADLRRFVLFFGHRFDDRLSFNSEVEWEHAVTSADDKGEAEIEQAYLNYGVSPGLNLKAGLFLMPFGFLNQSHEPPVYYGVERNNVETRIIPSTWREGGVGLYGSTDSGLAWDLGVTTGFSVAKFDDPSSPLASIHQELQLANARDLATYGALNYRGVPGLTVGAAVFSGNSGQGNAAFKADNTQPDFSGINARVTLWDVHTRWQAGGADIQALYAKGMIADADKIDSVLLSYNNQTGANRPYVPSEFTGWLVQGAYTVWRRGNMSLAPFVRYEQYNTQSKMPLGIVADPANADRVTTIGFSFRPHPQVVLKADYQKYRDNPVNDSINLGLGYMF